MSHSIKNIVIIITIKFDIIGRKRKNLVFCIFFPVVVVVAFVVEKHNFCGKEGKDRSFFPPVYERIYLQKKEEKQTFLHPSYGKY